MRIIVAVDKLKECWEVRNVYAIASMRASISNLQVVGSAASRQRRIAGVRGRTAIALQPSACRCTKTPFRAAGHRFYMSLASLRSYHWRLSGDAASEIAAVTGAPPFSPPGSAQRRRLMCTGLCWRLCKDAGKWPPRLSGLGDVDGC